MTLTTDIRHPQNLSLPTEMPQPKFWFGQVVRFSWVNDDRASKNFGEVYWVEGKIMGVIYSHPDLDRYAVRWGYYVDATNAHPAIFNTDIGYIQYPFAEEELEAVL